MNATPIPAALAIDALGPDARAAFAIASNNRYRAIAFATSHPELNPDLLGQTARRHLRSILSSQQLGIEALRSPSAQSSAGGGLVDPATIDRTLDTARRALTLARELGVKTVGLNIGRLGESAGAVPDSTIIAALRDLAQHADASGLTLAVSADASASRLAVILKAVDFDGARMNLETAGAIAAGEDPLGIAEQFAGMLGEVTLADAIRAGKTLRHATLGEGQLPLAELLRHLNDQGFRGPTLVDLRNLQNAPHAAECAAQALRRAMLP